MQSETESKKSKTIERLYVPPDLGHRIRNLVTASEFGFESLQHFLAAALHSFVSYKERQLKRIREDREGWR